MRRRGTPASRRWPVACHTGGMAAIGFRTMRTSHVEPGSAHRIWLALLALLVLCLGWPAPAAKAHAQLIGSTPANGSIVEQAPNAVELVFNEDVNPAFAQVIVRDHAGQTVASQPPEVDGPKVITRLPVIGPGQVTVLFRVTSKDAHPISGKVSFIIDGEPGFAAPSATASTGATDPGSDGGDQQALGAGPNSAEGGPPAAWAYVVTGLVALALMGLGAVVLRRERRTRVGHPAAPAASP